MDANDSVPLEGQSNGFHHVHSMYDEAMNEATTSTNEGQEALISSIKNTLAETEGWIHSVLDTLGWTEEHLLQQEEKLPCPVDSSHILPKSQMDRHLSYCPLVKAGYTKEDLDEERTKSSKFFYEKATKVVSLDLADETIKNVLGRNKSGCPSKPLPVTMDRATTDLSTNEKLRLYEFCVQTARATNKMASLKAEDIQLLETKEEKDSKSRYESRAAQQAAERDLKRRRQSYRKKGVHTANKSYSEVIKEVIEQQTELLAEQWDSQKQAKKRADRREQRERDEYPGDEDRHKGRSRDDRHRSKGSSRRERSSSPDVSDDSRHSSKKHKHKHKKSKKHKHKTREEEKD